MKAFIVDRYGKKRSLREGEVPEPELREDEVLVRVHAAAVNLLDSKIRRGEFKLILPYRPPFVLGHDVAGVVVRIGYIPSHRPMRLWPTLKAGGRRERSSFRFSKQFRRCFVAYLASVNGCEEPHKYGYQGAVL